MWKWKNVPIPPQHIVGLLLALALHYLLPSVSVSVMAVGRIFGVVLVPLGIGLGGWSVWVTGSIEVDAPARLINSGPYSFSRNPMYVAWSLLYLGLGLAVSSPWLLATLPIVLFYTHFIDVRREEAMLEARFGQEFRQYRQRVPRYF